MGAQGVKELGVYSSPVRYLRLSAVALFLACTSTAPLPTTRPPGEVPFELTQNHVFLPVSVGERAPSWFLLDTGAQFSALAQTTVEAMHIETQGEGRARGAGAAVVRTTILSNIDLKIGGLPVNLSQMAGLPLTPISLSEGRAIEGIVGYSVIREFVVEIDYARRLVRLHDPATFAVPNGAVVVPITFNNGHPVVAAALTLPDGRTLPMRMMVDTGARGAVVINRPFAEKNLFYDTFALAIDAALGLGIGGATHQRFGRAKRFDLGGFALEAPIVSAALDRAGATASAEVDGMIGGELLRRFTVTFDYAHRRLLLAPNNAFTEPFEFDMFGASFNAADLKFDRILVRFVLPNTPAAEAGLKEDDEIVTIDGRSAAALTIGGMRELFEKPDQRHVLHVRRGGRELDITVVTRRLL